MSSLAACTRARVGPCSKCYEEGFEDEICPFANCAESLWLRATEFAALVRPASRGAHWSGIRMIDSTAFTQQGSTGNDVREVLRFIHRHKIIRFIRPSFYLSGLQNVQVKTSASPGPQISTGAAEHPVGFRAVVCGAHFAVR